MKPALLLATFAVMAVASVTHAVELGSVVVEEAWLVPADDPGAATLYLVINNRTSSDIMLEAISTPVASTARVLRPSGKEFVGAVVPTHAELYMQPGGVHVALGGMSAELVTGQSVPVRVELPEGLPPMLTPRCSRPAPIRPTTTITGTDSASPMRLDDATMLAGRISRRGRPQRARSGR